MANRTRQPQKQDTGQLTLSVTCQTFRFVKTLDLSQRVKKLDRPNP